MKYRFLSVISVLIYLVGCSNEKKEVATDFKALDKLIVSFENELELLEKDIAKLASFTTYLLENQSNYIPLADKSKFMTSETGIFYNPAPRSFESSVYISTKAPDRQAAIDQLYGTELLDSVFYKVVSENDFVSQAYFNSKTQYSRLYPSYGVLSILEPDLDITSFNFYYLADGVRNPDKRAKWVEEIYIDPAGRGWVLSVIHPVYQDGKLQGVIGLDITVNDLSTRFLDLSANGLLILDGEGMIVAGKTNAIESLDMPPLKNHTYSQTINADNFQGEDFNLFHSKNREVRRMVSKFILEKESSFKLNINGTSHKVACKRMNVLNWYLIEIDNL